MNREGTMQRTLHVIDQPIVKTLLALSIAGLSVLTCSLWVRGF